MHGNRPQAEDTRAESTEYFHRPAIEFKKSIDIKPDYDFGNNNLAVCYAPGSTLRGGRSSAARRPCKSTAAMPTPTTTWASFAAARTRYAEAVHYHLEGMKVRPDRPSDHRNLGRAYEQLGDTQRRSDPRLAWGIGKLAASEYMIALQIDPSDGHGLLRGGRGSWQNVRVLQGCGESLAAAMDDTQSLAQLPSQRQPSLGHAGVIYMKTGEMNQAEAHTRQALEIDPQIPCAGQNLKDHTRCQGPSPQAKIRLAVGGRE